VSTVTSEWCPECMNEVKLENKFEIQECPSCSFVILPCSICTRDKCRECPLEEEKESLKEWVKTVSKNVYNSDFSSLTDVQHGELLDIFAINTYFEFIEDQEEWEKYSTLLPLVMMEMSEEG
jgi:hypothetical protein